jgi:hypothetical protein
MVNAFGPNGSTLYFERDITKRDLCALRGITLIDIPFWYVFLLRHLATQLLIFSGGMERVRVYQPLCTKHDRMRFLRVIRSLFLVNGLALLPAYVLTENVRFLFHIVDHHSFLCARVKFMPIPGDFHAIKSFERM